MPDVLSEDCADAWANGEERCFFEGVIELGQSGEGSDRLNVGAARFDGDIKFVRSNARGSVDVCFAGASGEAETDTDSSAALS